MRSVQSVSALAHGERFPVAVGDGGVAFGYETVAVVSPGTLLSAWSNADQLRAGVFADGSELVTVQSSAPAAPTEGQWWFESVGGVPVLVVYHNGVSTVIGTPSGSAVGVTSLSGSAGINVSASTGSVGLSIDFTAVAHATHTHGYLALDGSTPMTGALHTIDGTYMNPAIHGSDYDTGIVFGANAVSFVAAGGIRATITPAGIVLGNYTIPAVGSGTNSTLIFNGNAANWGQLPHSALGSIGQDDHHNRSHAMSSIFDHSATAWQMFYSDASGHVQETGLGSSGYALLSGGPTAAPHWGAILAKPSRTSPGVAVGYNFVDSPNTGMTADAASVYLVLAGTTVLDVNASRLRVGVAGSLVDYPTARGAVGQVMTQQASGVAGWGDLPVGQAAPSVDVTAFHRVFMFSRN